MPYLGIAVGLVQGVLDSALGHSPGCVSGIAQHPERRGGQVPSALQEGGPGSLQPQACSSTTGVSLSPLSAYLGLQRV